MARKHSINWVEARVYEHQAELIKKKYGQDAADKANYGWGVDGNEDEISVASKVYVDPIMVLQTNSSDGKSFVDEWIGY